tara:strand:+ start:404 stop:508 length:105 start_codon:yes stop_codon:yes gene_type:complete
MMRNDSGDNSLVLGILMMMMMMMMDGIKLRMRVG